ncbi:hypothetical protein K466DRAFT_598874 [Polyporus arcularius HHB13444]|uniref:Uncharacterized protein n=1 Tax=Polyporus arcularius HHB13444 TaxID=1314778 RepID=A0A5C3PFV9_9APHY|nr:hypothetical protein K466DRAFT_598874 [Polyporus arcularius HHB13444]
MFTLNLPVFPTLRARFRRRTSETVTDSFSDALAVLPRGSFLRVSPPTARPKATQDIVDLAEEIAELYKQLQVHIAAREARDPATVATPYDEPATSCATLPSPYWPSPPHPEPSSMASKNDVFVTRIASEAIYLIDGQVAKENNVRFQVRGLRKLDVSIPEADYPDFLFIHYTRMSSAPVGYVRALPTLPKDAFGCIDLDALAYDVGLRPRVAHLHISDDEQVPRHPYSLNRNAVLSLAVGEQRSEVLRSRVIAKCAPRTCTAHRCLRSAGRSASNMVSRHLAARRPLPIDYPMFYGLYLPYESLTREMHTECRAGVGRCVEMSPILLVEDLEAAVAAPPVWRAACMKHEVPVRMRPFALNAPAMSVM